MNEELSNKSINKLTEEKVDQSNPSMKEKIYISFHRATLYDCIRADGLALDIDLIQRSNRIRATLHIPEEITAPVPSAFLCEHLLHIEQSFVLDNEKSCRILIDAILTEALLSESNENFKGYCDVANHWQGTRVGYLGYTDYMFASKAWREKDMDSCLLVVQAKKEWPDDAVAQVLCHAGCVLKKRLAAGKNTPVFAVLTSGLFFRFFVIDADGVVYSSGAPIILGCGPEGDYTNSPTLSEILRWFNWFITAAKLDITTDYSLARLRSCFGPKNPVPTKKLKVKK